MGDPYMVELSQTGFFMGNCRVSPAEGILLRGNETVHLEPKVMDVLVYFASRPGEVITREELERDVWRGALIGYDAVTATVIKLRKALGDDAKQPRFIMTIPKKGYQLIATVSSLHTSNVSAETTTHDTLNTQPDAATMPASMLKSGIVIAIVLLFIAGFSALWYSNKSNTQDSAIKDTKPFVVVLPFNNLSGDSGQDYFSDGITDDLITDLSKVDALRVIARQSSYYYREHPAALDTLAEELDMLYLVEGSVQKFGERVRVNVQLSNTKTDQSIWGERIDTDSNNLFDIQDKITRHVIDAMLVTLSSSETQHITSRSTNNFKAYDTFLAGQQHIRTRTKQGYDQTMKAYQRAIEIDPQYARPYGAMAVAITQGYRFQWSDLSLVEARERALELANKAVQLNQSTPQIYWSLGFVHLHRREYDAAEAAAEQSVVLSPNYADGYALLAYISNWRGNPTKAISHITKATELNPYYTFEYQSILGLAYYKLGRYEEAVSTLKKALNRNESALNPRLFLAASYVQLDELEEAAWEISQLSINRPDATLSNLNTKLPFENKQLLLPLLEDLRKAGLPD